MSSSSNHNDNIGGTATARHRGASLYVEEEGDDWGVVEVGGGAGAGAGNHHVINNNSHNNTSADSHHMVSYFEGDDDEEEENLMIDVADDDDTDSDDSDNEDGRGGGRSGGGIFSIASSSSTSLFNQRTTAPEGGSGTIGIDHHNHHPQHHHESKREMLSRLKNKVKKKLAHTFEENLILVYSDDAARLMDQQASSVGMRRPLAGSTSGHAGIDAYADDDDHHDGDVDDDAKSPMMVPNTTTNDNNNTCTDSSKAPSQSSSQQQKNNKKKKPKKVKYTSLRKAAFHLFKGYVGVGIFLIPMFYRDAGYVVSPLLGVLICLMVIDTTLMLLSSKYIIDRPETVMSYPDVTQFVLGKTWRAWVNYMLVPMQFGFCLMYIQTAAGIFSEIISFKGAYVFFVLVQAAALFPMTLLTRRLSLLAIGSMIASVLVVLSIVATSYYIFDQLQTEGVSPSVTTAGSLRKYSLFAASQMVVMEGVGIILPVENSLKPESRKKFPTMLLVILLVITVLYALYGNSGYLAFGERLTESTVSVLPSSSTAAIATRLALAFNLVLSYPLQFTPAIQIIDRAFKCDVSRPVHKDLKACGVRAAIGVVIPLMTLGLGPDALELVMAFLGATAATFIGFILPAVLRLHLPVALLKQQQPHVSPSSSSSSSSLSSSSPNDYHHHTNHKNATIEGGGPGPGASVPVTASALTGALVTAEKQQLQKSIQLKQKLQASSASISNKSNNNTTTNPMNFATLTRGEVSENNNNNSSEENDYTVQPPDHFATPSTDVNYSALSQQNQQQQQQQQHPNPTTTDNTNGNTDSNNTTNSNNMNVFRSDMGNRSPYRTHKPCPYHPDWAPRWPSSISIFSSSRSRSRSGRAEAETTVAGVGVDNSQNQNQNQPNNQEFDGNNGNDGNNNSAQQRAAADDMLKQLARSRRSSESSDDYSASAGDHKNNNNVAVGGSSTATATNANYFSSSSSSNTTSLNSSCSRLTWKQRFFLLLNILRWYLSAEPDGLVEVMRGRQRVYLTAMQQHAQRDASAKHMQAQRDKLLSSIRKHSSSSQQKENDHLGTTSTTSSQPPPPPPPPLAASPPKFVELPWKVRVPTTHTAAASPSSLKQSAEESNAWVEPENANKEQHNKVVQHQQKQQQQHNNSNSNGHTKNGSGFFDDSVVNKKPSNSDTTLPPPEEKQLDSTTTSTTATTTVNNPTASTNGRELSTSSSPPSLSSRSVSFAYPLVQYKHSEYALDRLEPFSGRIIYTNSHSHNKHNVKMVASDGGGGGDNNKAEAELELDMVNYAAALGVDSTGGSRGGSGNNGFGAVSSGGMMSGGGGGGRGRKGFSLSDLLLCCRWGMLRCRLITAQLKMMIFGTCMFYKIRCLIYIIIGLYVMCVGTVTCVADAMVFFGGGERGGEAAHEGEGEGNDAGEHQKGITAIPQVSTNNTWSTG